MFPCIRRVNISSKVRREEFWRTCHLQERQSILRMKSLPFSAAFVEGLSGYPHSRKSNPRRWAAPSFQLHLHWHITMRVQCSIVQCSVNFSADIYILSLSIVCDPSIVKDSKAILRMRSPPFSSILSKDWADIEKSKSSRWAWRFLSFLKFCGPVPPTTSTDLDFQLERIAFNRSEGA